MERHALIDGFRGLNSRLVRFTLFFLVPVLVIARRFIGIGRRLSKRADRDAQSRVFLAGARAEADKRKPFGKFAPHLWGLP